MKRTTPSYAWTDLTYLLHKNHVSWRYYVAKGKRARLRRRRRDLQCRRRRARARRASGIRCPTSTTVRQDGQLGNIKPLHSFFAAARDGTLPAVSWIAPSDRVSEHPPSRVSARARRTSRGS